MKAVIQRISFLVKTLWVDFISQILKNSMKQLYFPWARKFSNLKFSNHERPLNFATPKIEKIFSQQIAFFCISENFMANYEWGVDKWGNWTDLVTRRENLASLKIHKISFHCVIKWGILLFLFQSDIFLLLVMRLAVYCPSENRCCIKNK